MAEPHVTNDLSEFESFASTEPLPNNKNKRHVFSIARERERIVLDVVILHDGVTDAWCLGNAVMLLELICHQ
jgi:hypothetical protein